MKDLLLKNKPFIVYLNKKYNASVSDAYTIMKDKNISKDDIQEVLSETVFYSYLSDGLINAPCLFVKNSKVAAFTPFI